MVANVLANPVLHHVNLKTTRLQEMIDWYGKVAGMKVNHLAPVGAWLTNDAANHRLAFLAVPGLSDDDAKDFHTGIHHLAFEFADMAALFETFARLRDLGIRPPACLDHGMTVSMYYLDPDRNLVELQADAFGDWAKSSEWMTTSPDFVANPIGVFFDPDQAHAFLAAGHSAEELHRAAIGGDFLPDPIPPMAGLPPLPPPA